MPSGASDIQRSTAGHAQRNLFLGLLAAVLILIEFMPQPSMPAALADTGGAIRFSIELEEGISRAKKSGKPLAVLFHALWCPHCRELIHETLEDPRVVRAAEPFEWVLLDLDRHVSLAHEYGVATIPQLMFMDRAGAVRAVINGSIGAEELQARLSAIRENLEPEKRGVGAQEPLQIQAGSSTVIFTTPEEYRAQAICFSNVGYGPLRLASQSPLQALRLGMEPRTPSTLMKGQKEFGATASWVNIWANESEYFFDYEMLDTRLSFGYGVSDAFDLELGLEARSRFGGAMDGLIQGFHDFFGISQNGRDQVPKNDFHFDIKPRGDQPGVNLNGSDRGIYSTNALMALQYNLTCGTRLVPAFSVALTLRYELYSADLEGGGPLDAGISVAVSRRFGPIYLYGVLGYAVFGRERFREAELRRTQFTGLAAVEWRAFKKASILLQYLASQGAAEDLGELSEFSNEVTLGAKWEVHEGTLLEIGLIENIITYGNSPDFGIHLGLKTRF